MYKLSMHLGDRVWDRCVSWDYFSKTTLDTQMISAADSIALNIAEGYGQFHFKELRQFCFI